MKRYVRFDCDNEHGRLIISFDWLTWIKIYHLDMWTVAGIQKFTMNHYVSRLNHVMSEDINLGGLELGCSNVKNIAISN